MPNLGTKYVCYSCQTKFYDLGRSTAVCPKCGADQMEAEKSSAAPSTRKGRVVEEFEEEPDLELETPEIEEEEDEISLVVPVGEDVAEDAEEEADDDEEEDY